MPRPRHLATALSFIIAASLGAAEPPPLPEPVCGPGLNTLGDGWENSHLELYEMNRLIERGPLLRWPQRMAALVSHLRLIERRALPEPPPGMDRVRLGVRLVTERQMATNRLAFAGDTAGLREELGQLRAAVDLIGKQFAPAVLVANSPIDHLLPAKPATLKLEIIGQPQLVPGKAAKITVRLVDSHGQPIALNALHAVPGPLVHGYLLDDSLRDFQHVVPEPNGKPGELAFPFTPGESGSYRLWLQASPGATKAAEFPTILLNEAAKSQKPAPKMAPALISEIAGNRLELRFDGGSPRAGEIADGKVIVTNGTGEPVTNLEPLFGQFALFTAFPIDRSGLLHIPAAGTAPQPQLRGGPSVAFRFRPQTSGLHRFFAEVRIDGITRAFAFTFPVAAAADR